jgi:hypothetical protein
MVEDSNGIDKRLREVEQWKAGAVALEPEHERWRLDVNKKLDDLRIQQAKWLGAIAVIAFLASLFGSAIADRLK